MAIYDPKVIQEFADKLYKKASSIIATYTILGLVIGGVGGYSLVHPMNPILIVIAAVLFALLGFAVGREKSFMIKLQAQASLCQMKIKQNTRERAAKHAGFTVPPCGMTLRYIQSLGGAYPNAVCNWGVTASVL